MSDPSHGYDARADAFVEARSRVGEGVVRSWASSLPGRAEVLELACGAGVPVSEVLLAAGCRLWAVDASPRLLALHRARFPEAVTARQDVRDGDLFAREFDAVVAVGLLFLLSEAEQRALLARVAGRLRPGGRLLFSAPEEVGAWDDVLTGLVSRSLGREAYAGAMEAAGLTMGGSLRDAGGNHYYTACRPG